MCSHEALASESSEQGPWHLMFCCCLDQTRVPVERPRALSSLRKGSAPLVQSFHFLLTVKQKSNKQTRLMKIWKAVWAAKNTSLTGRRSLM